MLPSGDHTGPSGHPGSLLAITGFAPSAAAIQISPSMVGMLPVPGGRSDFEMCTYASRFPSGENAGMLLPAAPGSSAGVPPPVPARYTRDSPSDTPRV